MHVAQPSATDTAAVLVAWSNAWLTGHIGLDEAVDAIERTTGPHVVITTAGMPGLAGPAASASPAAPADHETPLRQALAGLRTRGLTSLRLALPVPGDPLGLSGPPVFNTAAIEAGQAALATLPERTIGLVPRDDLRGSSYRGIRWHTHEARHSFADVPSLPEADRRLTMAVREAADALMTIDDVSGPRPEIAQALGALRESAEVSGANGLAPGYAARAHRVNALAGRLTAVLELARGLETGMLTAEQMRRRSEALGHLDHAVRRARVAACNSAFDPVP